MAKNDPTREKRLAEQLRANLRRRKVQGWREERVEEAPTPPKDKD